MVVVLVVVVVLGIRRGGVSAAVGDAVYFDDEAVVCSDFVNLYWIPVNLDQLRLWREEGGECMCVCVCVCVCVIG